MNDNNWIIWTEAEIKLKDLKEYEYNPRRISKESFERLVRSIKEHGYNNRILVNKDHTIIGGHARKAALKKCGFKDNDNIKVLIPNRQLTDEEYKRLNVRDNGVFGEFDMDLLSVDFEALELIELGVPGFHFKEFTAPEDAADKDNGLGHNGLGHNEEEKNKRTCPNCNYEF